MAWWGSHIWKHSTLSLDLAWIFIGGLSNMGCSCSCGFESGIFDTSLGGTQVMWCGYHKKKPTWRNRHMGDSLVSRRITHFLLVESLIDRVPFFFQWVCVFGESQHHSVFLELREDQNKLENALKFNSSLLKCESLCKLVMENWVPYNPYLRNIVPE